MIIDAASIICDKGKEFEFKLCSYENRKTGEQGALKSKKRQDVTKFNRRHYNLQKRVCPIHEY